MIDHKVRSQGIGGSEVAAILGLGGDRDPFSVYVDKLGLLERSEPNQRMRWGKLLERAIVEGYSEHTGFYTSWSDRTSANPDRPWQVFTIDAFVEEKIDASGKVHFDGICDAKNVAFDLSRHWGEPGTDDVPIHIALQMQWYCSGANMPWADVAALFGGNDLRVYRVWRDAEIEGVLLEEVDTFWRHHILARVPPTIGASSVASEYLKQKFPRAVEQLRVATSEEHELLARLKDVGERWDVINKECVATENAVKLAIGDAEGLLDGRAKITWKRCKDQLGTDWESAAREVIEELAALKCDDEKTIPLAIADKRRELIGKHCVVIREGSRRLLPNWGR